MLKTQKMCNKAFNNSFFEFFYIPDQYKTQEMFDRIISNEPFSMRYVPDQHKTKQIKKEIYRLLKSCKSVRW